MPKQLGSDVGVFQFTHVTWQQYEVQHGLDCIRSSPFTALANLDVTTLTFESKETSAYGPASLIMCAGSLTRPKFYGMRATPLLFVVQDDLALGWTAVQPPKESLSNHA
jgi:hypothetical protein